MKENSSDYYDQNCKEFFDTTVNLDMGDLHRRFLKHVPACGHILDAGCGSGRDAKAFQTMGYRITAFDASSEMVRLASEYTGIQVLELSFENLTFKNEFDGIWACASLLHVPRTEIRGVLTRLTDALVVGGAFYLSFKYGNQEEERNGRWFNNYNEKLFIELIANIKVLSVKETWITSDVRPGRNNQKWLNIILKKERS